MDPPDEAKTGKLVVGDWNTIVWRMEVPLAKDATKLGINISINGVVATEGSQLGESVHEIAFKCSEGSILVGSVEYLRDK